MPGETKWTPQAESNILLSQEPLDEPLEVRRDISWARRQTVSIDVVPAGRLLGFLREKSVVVAGEVVDGSEDVALVLPTISTNSVEKKGLAESVAERIRKDAIHQAAMLGFISPEAAEEKLGRIEEGTEPKTEIVFQETPGLLAVEQRKRLELRNAQSRVAHKLGAVRTSPGPKVYQIPQVSRGRDLRNVILAGGIAFVAGACSSFRDATPTTVSSEAAPATVNAPYEMPAPTETLEPIPTTVPGDFEYDFDPTRPDYIPAKVAGAGGLGEIIFNRSLSGGGEIATDVMKEEGLRPLVFEGSVLSAESGHAVFLPFPERMSYELSEGVLEELTFSQKDSNVGSAAYVDADGVVRQRMLIQIPTSTEGEYIAGISYNSEDLGTVYLLRLAIDGDILERANLVFPGQTEIQTKLEAGYLRIFINGERVVLQNGEFERFVRQVGVISLGDYYARGITQEMREPLGQDRVRRIYYEDGTTIPFGYLSQYKEEHSTGLGEVSIEYFSGIVRGWISAESGDRYQGSLVVEIPNQEGHSLYVAITMYAPPEDWPDNFIPYWEFSDGNLGTLEGKAIRTRELNEIFQQPEVVGQQIVFAFQSRAFLPTPEGEEINNTKIARLFEAIGEGTIYSDTLDYILNRLWAPRELRR